MEPQVVMAVYLPKKGKDEALLELVKRHLPTLRRLGLATDRPAMLLKSKQAYIEIFEWVSSEASAQAHTTPEIAEIWEAMGEIADFPPLGVLEEASRRFPHFAAVDGIVDR